MQINNELVKENSELRKLSRNQLKGKWGTAILLCLVYLVIITLLNVLSRFVHNVGPLITPFLIAPIALGLISCFINLVRNQPFRFENLFDGFKNYISAILVQWLSIIFIALWTLLLFIPGLIAGYRYSMIFYILNDNPEIGALGAIKGSKEMMKGFKWKLFCLHLSFIGWGILSILTAGIGLLWLIPYMCTANANFYQNLKDASIVENSYAA